MIDLVKIGKKVDALLEHSTPESLSKFLNSAESQSVSSNEDKRKPCDCKLTCRYTKKGNSKYYCRSVD